MIRIYKVNPLDPDSVAIKKASEHLKKGGLVVFPTETVYGLGADAFNPEACLKVFKAKERPPDNPLIIHIASQEELSKVAKDMPDFIWNIVSKAWPGPLTLVLPRADDVPREATGGRDTVAVRSPAHPVALSLIKYSGVPIAAPSANKSGRPSPTTAEHVIEDYSNDDVDMVILDAGPTFFGVESTIVDVTKNPPVLLRPGPFTLEELRALLGSDIIVPEFARGVGEADIALAPGMKYRHYAPRTNLTVVECYDYASLIKLIKDTAEDNIRRGLKIALVLTRETKKALRSFSVGVPIIEMGSRSNPYTIASRLFDTLRALDKLGVDLGVVEGIEERGIGLAVMNRLRKASGFSIIKC